MLAPFVFLLLSGIVHSKTFTRFTNIKCEVLDPSFCIFEQCHLKVLGRGIIGLNVQVKLLKGPLNKAKVNLSLWRKYNGFRPFMFNKTIDFCKFMSKSTNTLSAEKLYFDAVADKSNINHSCPYENELRVKDLVLKEHYFKFIPLPSGEYQIKLAAAADNKWRAKVSVNLLRQEDLMNS